MLATTHVLVGGAIGDVVGMPYYSFIVSVIVHILIDKIPHFWPKRIKDKVLLNIVDWTTATVIFLIFAANPIDNKASVLAGAFGGVIVDIFLVGFPYFYNRKVGDWHSNRQPHQTRPIYLTTDLLFIIPLVLYFSTKG